ncbi:PEGA domain-containing protein [Brucepastera parasyntrophica]|uniref:PEGA domain-containing protein n=1 Tax=Brucepastera parasyntrophica TaxID=2880008 RepID=UPI00210AEE12|nr:PEGA domain-containing protein [Brucepastera parasyntrophica]ULQ60292.1 PEGA domain-containing protein [Brucepastera parasyntrophica]
MKKCFFIVSILLSFSFIAMAQSTISQPGTGGGTTSYTLTIKSTPSNAVVYVDGNKVSGNSVSVTPGTHAITAQASGYTDFSASVNVRQNMTYSIVMTAAPAAVSQYTLTLRVSPSNATVYVDGNRISGNSVKVAAGAHIITARASGYNDFSASVNVQRNMTYSIVMTAAATAVSQYTLNLQISPSNAAVYVDGSRVSGTSIRLARGQHVITANAQGYADYSATINLQQNMTVPVSMVPLSYRLTVTANVSSALIYVDGTRISGNTVTVSSGIHTIRVEAAGYQDYTTQVEVTGNTTVPVILSAALHSITVNASNFRGAQVQIDGRQVGVTPYTSSFSPGTYTVSITAPGYETYSERITVNGSSRLEVFLQQTGYSTISFILPEGIAVGQGNTSSRDRVDIYVDGVQQTSGSFQIQSGTHTIRLLSGNFTIDQTIEVQSGKSYIIQPMLQVIVQ